MPIKLLTPETIGKIAAGEVVERPSSVVKELIENALDASAHRISVDVRGGGIESIEISDDGIGISPDELSMALERHATSKLRSFDDLDTLATLGFRGEALASISAVSSFAIRSRTEDRAAGTSIRVEFGDRHDPMTVASPGGTTVSVRDLFGNVPARRKFLRQPSTEHGYVGRVVAAYACAYPHVQFSLTFDGRNVIATNGSGDYLAAASGVFGVEVGKAALLIEPLEESAAVPGVTVDGWIGAPTVSRSHRQDMIFFVNGRWVQHRAMSFALEEAYHSLLMVGRHPIAFLHVHVDPASIDVNVHPTKAEIKFQDERSACRAVQRSAHAALARAPHDDLPGASFSPMFAPVSQPAFMMPMPAGRVQAIEPANEVSASSQSVAHQSGVPMLRVLGQVGASYIVAEGPDGMYLIDQHAAHERVMYEKIATQMRNAGVDRQQFLDPLLVELPHEEYAVFEKSRDDLDAIGFEIEPFGDAIVAVRSIPALVTGVDVPERLHLILQELADGGAGESWFDSVAISAACHTAIRAGQTLSLAEMRELVNDLERTSQPRACGHGRPTMLHMSQVDLEKQFSRR
ncbi:MAG TPA: DNA mismatch repair endonuclease MutL [Casimicrobiaceae bacterium]|nr:DNA mismatch repair endonuclease MutL [Casimicrobiaceae bacterium]